MGIEIERKYTVNDRIHAKIASLPAGEAIKQGYLSKSIERNVRVRSKGDKGYLTIKGKTEGISRQEFEYEIPLADALQLLALCEPIILEKTRYTFSENNLIWELDVFEGVHAGLIIAEVELSDAQQEIILPDWIEREVSDDPRYYNASLAGK